MKIQKVHLTNLRSGEYFQFQTDVRNLITEFGADALKIAGPFAGFLDLYARLDEALKKIMKSAITAQIHDLDAERDNIFLGLVETNRAAMRHFDKGVREAATRNRIVFDAYGNVAKMTINEETAFIYNLLKDLMQKHAADVEAVDLGKWITELDRLNVALDKLMRERYEEIAGRTNLDLREVRARMDESYRELTVCIEAMGLLADDAGKEKYADLTRRLNAIVERANDILAARRGRAEATATGNTVGDEVI